MAKGTDGKQPTMARLDSQITYLILLPEKSEDTDCGPPTTFFHGFSRELVTRSSWVRQVLNHCPPTVIEAFDSSPKILQLRLSGITYFRIAPLIASDLQKLNFNEESPFLVLLCDAETITAANDWAGTQSVPVLIVERPPQPTEQPIISREAVKTHVRTVCQTLNRLGVATEFDELVLSTATRPTFVVDFEFSGHNVTIPNELVLLSVGGLFRAEKDRLEGPEDSYVERIIEGADAVAYLRASVPAGDIYRVSPPMPRLILTCPTAFKHIAALRPSKAHLSNSFFRMLRLLQKQSTYCLVLDDTAEIRSLIAEPSSKWLQTERTLESSSYTDCVSARAASYLSPVIKLSPAVGRALPHVLSLAGCLRGKKPTATKLEAIMKRLSKTLTSAIGPELLRRIDQPHEAVKLISDFPLEWLPLRGLPLAFRHVVSRIPATPGNLSFLQTLPRDQTELTPKSFSDTLVIRSFEPGDPLKFDLQRAVQRYRLDGTNDMPVRFVDVKTRDEFVEAVNGFDGALLIFDGHAEHNAHTDVATLRLADERVNCWNLERDIRCPPLVFACGCDTHAIGGSHVTSGNGFLMCGAAAVISTALPIDSEIAGIFAGRLLFNIYEFISKAIESKHVSFRWDFVFSTILRMMFVSELMPLIRRHDPSIEKWETEIQIETTLTLLDCNFDWYERLLEAVAHHSKLSVEEIDTLRSKYLPFPECLKYIHLGNPDTVVIGPSKVIANC
jgi:hypothetical protein